MWKLKPGETTSYSEIWQLLEYPKTTDKTFNADEAVRFAQIYLSNKK